MKTLAGLDGSVARGFEPVREEFRRNFDERGELGAAFAVEWNGEPVVDVWGGSADRASGTAWARDTMQIIFSGTKGLVAACMLLLLDRGRLELDVPVYEYWPEFAAAGKEGVLVRDVVAHTARLPGLETPVTWQEATDSNRMAALLAQQAQSSDPRAAATYHALTYGWLCGEIVRRVDGRSIGRFFADEIAQPLDLELWIGLPERFEPRVATVELSPTWDSSEQAEIAEDPLLRSIANPVRYQPGSFPWNERRWRAAEIPGANAIGTARSIAHFYDNLHRLLSPETLERARLPLSRTQDTLLGRPTAFGVGFQLQTSERPLGPPAGAFGHGGSGGSMHGCWPDQGVAFSYAMNSMRNDEADIRARALLDALYGVVGGSPA
jgi:CubicO group peptidase (beta-lactamase class C family)